MLDKRIDKNSDSKKLAQVELSPFESFNSRYGYSFFQFDQDRVFFIPLYISFSEISAQTDSVISNSDLEIREGENGDYFRKGTPIYFCIGRFTIHIIIIKISKITLTEQSYIYDKQIDFHFFVKNADFEYDEYKVESFEYKVKAS